MYIRAQETLSGGGGILILRASRKTQQPLGCPTDARICRDEEMELSKAAGPYWRASLRYQHCS